MFSFDQIMTKNHGVTSLISIFCSLTFSSLIYWRHFFSPHLGPRFVTLKGKNVSSRITYMQSTNFSFHYICFHTTRQITKIIRGSNKGSSIVCQTLVQVVYYIYCMDFIKCRNTKPHYTTLSKMTWYKKQQLYNKRSFSVNCRVMSTCMTSWIREMWYMQGQRCLESKKDEMIPHQKQ